MITQNLPTSTRPSDLQAEIRDGKTCTNFSDAKDLTSASGATAVSRRRFAALPTHEPDARRALVLRSVLDGECDGCGAACGNGRCDACASRDDAWMRGVEERIAAMKAIGAEVVR